MSDRKLQTSELFLRSKIQRSDLLGNHYKKNLRNIQEFLPFFLQRLEESGTISHLELDKVSPFCYEEMDLIRHHAHGRKEAFDLLSCYYSFKLINMNLNLLDFMEEKQELMQDKRTALYRKMLLRSEIKFSLLYAALIQTFLEILSEDEDPLPEFVICHVGARRDQDDIDVGIAHRPGGDLFALNRVIGGLNKEMYRRATQMHFYLSEHSGSKWFSASIDDYEKLMDLDLKNFVIITQLFGAVPITGSISLFKEFQKRVVRRYTYRQGEDNRYYEGFLRGVIEEIRSLVSHRSQTREIVPKVDGLRLAKLLIIARRATFGIVGGQFWNAFETLREKDPLFQEEYAFLEEAIAFMESVRFLYQLILVQEEGIPYLDPYCRTALDRVALLMGYERANRGRPSTLLLRDYFRYSRRIMEISGIFKKEFNQHVGFIKIFRGLVAPEPFPDSEHRSVNVPTDFIEAMERFHLPFPWEEFIGFLEEEEVYRQRFFHDLDLLSQEYLTEILKRYVASIPEDGKTLIRFLLCFLKSHQRDRMKRLEDEMINIFWKRFRSSSIFKEGVFQYLLEEELRCSDLVRNLSTDFVLDLLKEIRKSRWNLKHRLINRIFALAFQYHYRSPLLQRKMDHLVAQGMVHEEELSNIQMLRTTAKKVYKELSSLPTLPARRQTLANYYDLETLRFSFRSILAGRFLRADYMDIYIRRLMRISIQEAGLSQTVRESPGFGLYAAGGNARSKACEHDYDMFVLYDPSRIDHKLLNCAVQKTHREMARLGSMPHHRIAEKIGCFAISIEELEAYLDRGDPEDYVERSELLGSRMVLGGKAFHRLFVERIITQRVLREKKGLIQSLKKELRDLHSVSDRPPGLNLKLGRGGLFDITLLTCMLKAFYEIYESSDLSTLQLLRQKSPSHAKDYKILYQARNFLTDVRGLLRLTGYTEIIDESMDIRYPALLKGFSDQGRLFNKISKQMSRVEKTSDRLIEELL